LTDRSAILTETEKPAARQGAREPILAAAAELFHARGYSATSMQDIARAAGLSRPALYYHFRDKHDILSALVEQITLRTEREAARIAASAPDRDPPSILREIVRAHALVILERPAQFSVLLREERHLPEPARATQQRGKRDLLERFSSVIADGAKAGYFRAVDPYLAALGIFGMCNWTVEWFKPAGRLREIDVADAIADFALAMVSRPPGGATRDAATIRGWIDILRDDLAHLDRMVDGAGRGD
jgi:AcrR family transcriptional regulator